MGDSLNEMSSIVSLKNKISRIHFAIVFIIFRETGFTFHANCLQSMHEMSNLFFLGKIRKNISDL